MSLQRLLLTGELIEPEAAKLAQHERAQIADQFKHLTANLHALAEAT